jgi:hypothetical protein
MADSRKPSAALPLAAVATPATPAKRGRTPLSPDERERRKEMLKSEPKDARFRRLAIHRMPRAVKSIKAIGHLANRSQYVYTQEQVNKILDTLDRAVDQLRAKFSGNRENGDSFAF